MKKIMVILLIGCMFLGSFQVTSINEQSEDYYTKTIRVDLTNPQLSVSDSYIQINVVEQTSKIWIPGEPWLPKISRTFVLPFNAMVTDIHVDYSSETIQHISSLVQPSPLAVVDGKMPSEEIMFDEQIYNSDSWYPSKDYSVQSTVGLKDKQHVRYLTIHCYPIRYQPKDDLLKYYTQINAEVEYQLPSDTIVFPDESDLLIIAPDEFTDELQPLINHKINVGMRTYLKTLDSIYDEFNSQARDDQEKIKRCIQNEIETKGISYVLLVGGIKGQSTQWYLPVRYGHSPSEDAYVSDLYYADIYKIDDNVTVFDDWDSNGNGKIGEFSSFKRDDIDGSPDVYVGRLPCRNEKEVTTVVNKIITYEETKADESWFKNMLLIGGDTYPYDGGYTGCEAEIDTNLSASYMDGFTFERLWASTGVLTGQKVVEDAINDGAGLIHMAGHANPASLVTHPPFDKSESIIIMQMYNFYDLSHVFPKLNNADKLPVILVGGCHNSQFNVTLSNIFRDIKEYGLKKYVMNRFFYMEWVPECWSWWLTSKADGGAIATMGNTGLGMGIGGEDYVTGLDGWLYPRFFYHYGQQGIHYTGMAHGLAITDYVNEFNINRSGEDRQMVQQWALLGDPSLLIGGYGE